MDLPKAVQNQADYVSAMEAQIAAANAPAPAEPEPAPEPAPEPVPEQQVEARAAEPSPVTEQPVDWRHKYQTLQGMFNSQMQQSQAKIQELESKVAELARAPKAPEPEEPQVPALDPEFISKSAEAFGSELIGVIQRIANDEARKIFASAQKVADDLKAQLAQVQQGVGTMAQPIEEVRLNNFLYGLSQVISDWQQVNVDQRFIDWLAEIDGFSGRSKQDLFNDAVNARDVQRTAAFFNRFKVEAGIAPQPAPTQAAQAQPAAPSNSRLERQAQPGRSATGSSPAPTSNEVAPVTEGQIREFYTAVAKGQFAGREAEMNAREAAINAAVSRGLIVK